MPDDGSVGRIENQHYRVRPRHSRHLANQNVVRDALIFRARTKAVDARKIDQINLAPKFKFYLTHAVFYRYTRKLATF